MFAIGSTVLVAGVCAMLFATMVRSTPPMPIAVPAYTTYPPSLPSVPPSGVGDLDDVFSGPDASQGIPFFDPPARSSLVPVPEQAD